ncbi:MAG: RHS repeat-associated core domain-containing protein [Chloroflexota bacterium]
MQHRGWGAGVHRVLLSLALLCLLATGGAGPAAAQGAADQDIDVRGTWEWHNSLDCGATCGTLKWLDELVITRQDAESGEFRGRWRVIKRENHLDWPAFEHTTGIVTGTVDGDHGVFRDETDGITATGRFQVAGGRLVYDGAADVGGTVHGILVKPAAPRSAAGGDAPSATLVVCVPVVEVDPASPEPPVSAAAERCAAVVADLAALRAALAPTPGPDDSLPDPSGVVRWTSRGDLLVTPAQCDISATGACAVTVTTADGKDPGPAPQVVAGYKGDQVFGPSTGRPVDVPGTAIPDQGALTGGDCTAVTDARPVETCGDPVDPATGHLSLSVTDLAVGGRGPGLALTRTYDSAIAARIGGGGPFGRGWMPADEMEVETGAGADGAATAVLERGQAVTFRRKGRRFVAPDWATARLTGARDGTFRLTTPDGRLRTFDDEGRLASVDDGSGALVTVRRSADGPGPADGRVTALVDAAGRTIALTLDRAGQVTSAVDPAGATVRYAYDDAGRLVSVTDAAGGVTAYGYDDHDRLTSITGPDGGTTTTTWDAKGRVATQTDPTGATTSFAYLGSYPDQTTVVTDPAGSRTAYAYRNGVLVATTAGLGTPAGATTTYLYDAALRPVAVIDPDGRTWRTVRDDAGRTVAQIDPLGRVTRYAWDADGRPATTITPAGTVTRLAYDADGRLTAITRAAGTPAEATTTWLRDDPAHPADVTGVRDPLGDVTTIERDATGAIVAITDPTGATTTVGRDAAGRIATITDPDAAVTAATRDPLGRVASITDPLGGTTSLARDAAGDVTALVTAGEARETLTRDAAGRITGVTLPDGTTLGMTRDATGRVADRTTPAGAAWATEHDALGRPVAMTDPLGHRWTIAWSPGGRIVATTDPTGATTAWTWDAAGELVAIDRPGTDADVAFTYDLDGRRATMTDATGTTTWTRDPLGRVTAVTDPSGTTVTTTRDRRGDVRSIAVTDGPALELDRDAAGRIVAIRDGLGHETRFTWDAAGHATGSVAGNGVTTQRTLDAAGRPVAIAVTGPDGRPIEDLRLTRDATGRITAITDADGTTRTVVRDAAGRVTGLGASTATYDADGALASLDGTTFTSDAAGRLTAIRGPSGTTVMTSDDAGRRTAIAPDGGTPEALAWDAAGHLVGAGGASATWDGDGLRATLTDADGTAHRFTWDRSGPLPRLLGDGASWFVDGPDGQPFEEIRADGSVRWLHPDERGDIVAITDETGAVVGTAAYGLYGAPAATTGETTSVGFQGAWTDPGSGLIVLGARALDPATGRFLSLDPLVASTLAPTTFAAGDPVTWTDRTGALPTTPGTISLAETTALLDALGLSGVASTCTLADPAWLDLDLRMAIDAAAGSALAPGVLDWPPFPASTNPFDASSPFTQPLVGSGTAPAGIVVTPEVWIGVLAMGSPELAVAYGAGAAVGSAWDPAAASLGGAAVDAILSGTLDPRGPGTLP